MHTQTVNRYIRLTAACLFVCFGAWGVVSGLRAAIAQALYFQVRHGEESVPVDTLLSVSERAVQYYPYNFYLPYLVADRALAAAWDAGSAEESDRYLQAASFWCRQGLRLNPYRAEIQLTRTRLLEAEGELEAALAHWAAFVEREFWNPEHHAILAELQLRAGLLDAAGRSLALARRSRAARDLARQLEALQPAARR